MRDARETSDGDPSLVWHIRIIVLEQVTFELSSEGKVGEQRLGLGWRAGGKAGGSASVGGPQRGRRLSRRAKASLRLALWAPCMIWVITPAPQEATHF